MKKKDIMLMHVNLLKQHIAVLTAAIDSLKFSGREPSTDDVKRLQAYRDEMKRRGLE